MNLFNFNDEGAPMRAVLSRLRIVAMGVAVAILATFAVANNPPAAVAADYSAERWRSVEIPLTASGSYSDPFNDVEVTATFAGPGGVIITRPAFWDGGSTWRVRFAATAVGDWTMTTSSNVTDTGLNGVSRTLSVSAYSGSAAIYQHGFLKPSSDGHYLQHADGTPFFYLGDTHWIMPHERFSTSNAPDVGSQFKYSVDKRVGQGFTVYQSQPIFQPHVSHPAWTPPHTGGSHEPEVDLRNGVSSADMAGFAQLDAKFQYIADAGLVHANAFADWVTHPSEYPSVYTTSYMADLGRYWNARYGAYPAIWTVAQEIDNDLYGRYAGAAMAPWTAAIEALDAADGYDQPLMPHQEFTGQTTAQNSRFSAEPWHDGFASQPQYQDGWDPAVFAGYWASNKPAIAYETPYEGFWTDGRHALSALYKSYLSGMRGYGYGITGLWNDIYSKPNEPLDAGTDFELYDASGNLGPKYLWWYDAANGATGAQLTHGVNFFRSFEWWRLTPRFGDAAWSSFGASGDDFLASDGSKDYVALFATGTTSTGVIRQLDAANYYTATWFNPRTGASTTISNVIEPMGGEWTVPAKPTADDWVMRLTRGSAISNTLRPTITETGDRRSPNRVVMLSSATAGATVYYTTDGTTPTTSSTAYTGPISIADASIATLRAIATSPGRGASSETTATFAQSLRDLAVGGSYSASSQWNSSQSAQNAFDRSSSTNWQACNGCWSGQWLQVDFGANRTFDTVVLTEYASRTLGYKIQYWNGSSWADAYTGTTALGGIGVGSVIRFPEVTGSRVRILYSSGVAAAPIVYDFGVYDDPDLTTAATATSSSTRTPSEGAAKAIDGTPATNWQACEGCWAGQWLQVDFGSVRTFDTVTVAEYDNRTTGYRIEYWTGSAWATAYTGTGGFGPYLGSKTITFPPVFGSRMRLLYTSGSGSPPIVYELSVFNLPDYTQGTPSQGAEYVASSQMDANQGAAKAFDGSMSTNWQACTSCWAGQWLESNFHQTRSVSRVEVSEYNNRTTAYRIEYWNGSGWSTAYSGTGGFGPHGATTTITFAPVTTTSLRLLFVSGRETAPIIYEFSAFEY